MEFFIWVQDGIILPDKLLTLAWDWLPMIFSLMVKFKYFLAGSLKKVYKNTFWLTPKKTLAHTELKFRVGLANPRWIFNLGWKFQIFHTIDIFSKPDWKFDTTHARTPCLFLQKYKDFTSTFEMRRWQTYRPYKIFTRI